MAHKTPYLHKSSMTVNWIKCIYVFNYFHNVFLSSSPLCAPFVVVPCDSYGFLYRIYWNIKNSLFGYFNPFHSIRFDSIISYFFKWISYMFRLPVVFVCLDFGSIRFNSIEWTLRHCGIVATKIDGNSDTQHFYVQNWKGTREKKWASDTKQTKKKSMEISN